MCGLIAAINVSKKKGKKSVNSTILDLYENQYKRGTEGYGLITLDKNMKVNLFRSTEPYKFMYDLYNNKSSIIFAHHRTPTSTPNKIEQTHPISVDNKWMKYKYLGCHNGIIRNCDKLKKEHEERGIKYTTEIPKPIEDTSTSCGYHNSYKGGCVSHGGYTQKEKFNDSEAVIIELALFLEGLIEHVNFDGNAAFTIIQINKETNQAVKFHYGRHNNPLNFHRKGGLIQIASEGPGESIEEDKIFTLKFGKRIKITERDLTFLEDFAIKNKTEVKALPAGTATITNTERPTLAGTPPKKSATTMTEEDEADVQAEVEIPANLEAAFDNLKNEALDIFEDFELELQDEKSVYYADIEEHLIELKKIMKKMKGICVNLFRNLEEDTAIEEAAMNQASGYNKKVEQNNKIMDEVDRQLGLPPIRVHTQPLGIGGLDDDYDGMYGRDF